MSFFTIILIFLVSWWMVFFMLLPRGVVSQHEVEEERVEGTDPGAPVSHGLGKKALHATIAAVVITVLYYFVAESNPIDFRAATKPWEK